MLLYVNACVRSNSRTKELADTLVKKLGRSDVEEIVLADEMIPLLDEKTLEKRENCCDCGDFSDDMFRFAKQFAKADTVVIATPFWNLSFSTLLKNYLDIICVSGITFSYPKEGGPAGFSGYCKANKLYYVTTAGGKIFNNVFGYGQVEALATQLLGIKECFFFSAENLDIVGNDSQQILEEAKKKILECDTLV